MINERGPKVLSEFFTGCKGHVDGRDMLES